MPEQEIHAFEKQMNDDEFMNDAVEGLQSLQNKNEIPFYIQQLNADLKKQIDKKKKRKKRKLEQQPWAYISIILLLILIIAAYLVIKKIL